jgi:signal transduction histidine kinase
MRGYLVLLVVSVMVPVLLFAAVLFARYYTTALRRIDADLQNDARKLALTVDRDLFGLESTLQTLALSRALAEGDYQQFHVEAERVRNLIGVNILLRDVSGRQLLNTRVAWGTPLPRESVPGDQEVIERRQPLVTGVILGAVAKEPVYTVTVPVIQGDRVTHFLNLSLTPARLVDLLDDGLEPNHVVTVVDNKGLVLAQTRDADFVGKPAMADFVAAATKDEGVWNGANLDGRMVRAAYARSKLAGWKILITIPAHTIFSTLNDTLIFLAILGAALTGLAVLVAYAMGGRMARSMRVLARLAAALGRSENVTPQPLAVREADDIANALVNASYELRQRERERDKAEQNLRVLSETLERKVVERTQDLVSEMKRREQTEDTLRQVQKMEAIGQLTGGIAHDFNNMLSVILGSLDLAQRRLAKGERNIERFIATATEGVRRAAALTQRLLAFARQQPLLPQPLDANRLVSEMSELLRRSLGETVQLETVLAGGLWRTHADHNQLESAILNLAVNARDAMPEGGKLTIETGNTYFDEQYAALEGVTPGQYVMIAVSDTGTGMASDVAAKAFDPFFTTKKSGTGTGLGLSQVYGFVKQSGGHIKIYSEIGHGTSIKIYLPRHLGEQEKSVDASVRLATQPVDTETTILVVEDEATVRRYSVEALAELGYRVLDAESGAAALKLIDNHPEIDLLFTDVVMPEMNGKRLADEALKRRPSLKVLFTTGYTRNAIVHNAMLDPGVNLISKPFTLEQLALKVTTTLGA